MICANQSWRLESPPNSFERLQKWPHFPVRLPACCRTQNCVTAILMKYWIYILNCILKKNACNHDLVRCLADESCGFRGENKLVLWFSDAVLLPKDRFLRLIYNWQQLRLWNVFLSTQWYLFQRTGWVDGDTVTVALYCLPYWTSQYSILGLTEWISPIFFVPRLRLLSTRHACQKTCSLRTASSASWQAPCRSVFAVCS